MRKKSVTTILLCSAISSMSLLRVHAQEKKMLDEFPGKSFVHTPRTHREPLKTGTHLIYRSYDGTNNNLSIEGRYDWGATDISLFRELPSAYGSDDPYNAMGGENRPSAREISNVLCDEPITNFNARELSAFVYVWGQFLDHDISLTPQGTTEYIGISLPDDEPLFEYDIPFYRSEVHEGTGITNPREQTNLVTAWIDASMVYGSDSARAAWLRTFNNGKMKTSTGDLLPWNTITGEQWDPIDMNAPSMANDSDHAVKTFVAGDVRAAEHPGITALHTIFVREHNRICEQYVAMGLTDDEVIYQLARKQVGALIESITYREFLPALGISLPPYAGYNSDARSDITNTFATAGYRLGHTMVADDIALRDNNCEEVDSGDLDLADAFFNPQLMLDYGVEPFLKGFASHKQYETDNKINSVLRNFLFGGGFGIDLASLNIERGRDHGLPDYNTVRKFYTGTAVTSFLQITSDQSKAQGLKDLYGDVNNIDLWVGLLAEDLLPGKSVGKTINTMLTTQFQKLRDGDFHFYLHDPYLPSTIKYQIKHTIFKDVIVRNTTITNLQTNVFFTVPCPGEDGEDKMSDLANDDGSISNINIYPNPVSNYVSIDLFDVDESCTIKLLSSTGVVLKSFEIVGEKNLRIDMSDMPPGMYLLQIITRQEVNSFPVVRVAGE